MFSQAAARGAGGTKRGLASQPGRFVLEGIRYGELPMRSVGIRTAKARLSELARDAAKGEVTILTDYGKPIAMISSIEPTKAEGGSDAGEFREALLSLPYPLDLGF